MIHVIFRKKLTKDSALDKQKAQGKCGKLSEREHLHKRKRECEGVTINLEAFILQNVGMNSLLLFMAARMAAVKTGVWRLIVAGFIGCGYAVLAYLPDFRFLQGILPRLLVCMLMTGIAVTRRQMGLFVFVRAFLFVLVATCILGGTGTGLMYALGAGGYGSGQFVWLPMVCALAGAGLCVLFCGRAGQRHMPLTVQISVSIEGKAVCFMGVVDTGNTLREPMSNLPVIVVERGALRSIANAVPTYPVPFASVGGRGVLECFCPDVLLVDGKPAQAMIAAYDDDLRMEGQAIVGSALLMQARMAHTSQSSTLVV